MGLFGNIFFIFGLVDYFVIVIAIEPHLKIKDSVESLLMKSSWTWKHLNSSFKVESPVTVDVTLTSHYRLTGKHLNKILRQQCCLLKTANKIYNNGLKKQKDCASILKTIPNTKGRDGVYTIYPDMKTKKLVYCDMTTDGGGWTVILNRMDGSVDFYRSWQTYKEGFGKADGEYWLGNEDIHLLTSKTKNELRVDLQRFSGKKPYAKYSKFSVGSESEKYKLTVGGYSGNAGNSLSYHNGMKFSTKDQDNDTWDKSCAVEHQAGGWFFDCFNNNLNGLYHKSAVKTWNGVIWYHVTVSLKGARMMIRTSV